jgi:hypothetical protein
VRANTHIRVVGCAGEDLLGHNVSYAGYRRERHHPQLGILHLVEDAHQVRDSCLARTSQQLHGDEAHRWVWVTHRRADDMNHLRPILSHPRECRQPG